MNQDYDRFLPPMAWEEVEEEPVCCPTCGEEIYGDYVYYDESCNEYYCPYCVEDALDDEENQVEEVRLDLVIDKLR